MKSIRTACLFLPFLLFSHLHGQVVDNLKSFYAVYGLSVPAAFYYYDSVSITSSHVDTTVFSTIAQGNSGVNNNFVKKGQKIYKDDSLLLYDYDLAEGDTFFFNYFNIRDTFFVKNVFDSTLKARSHKIWRLIKSGDAYPTQLLWVEGLGSLVYGWDYSTYLMSDGTPFLKAWCVNDSLLVWDTSGYDPLYKTPAETCDFRKLSKTLAIEERSYLPHVKIYPVPVQSDLNIDLGGVFSGHAEIFNAMGQIVASQSFEGAEKLLFKLQENSSLLFVSITCGTMHWSQIIDSAR